MFTINITESEIEFLKIYNRNLKHIIYEEIYSIIKWLLIKLLILLNNLLLGIYRFVIYKNNGMLINDQKYWNKLMI